jgi:psp operon transcriptional activator
MAAQGRFKQDLLDRLSFEVITLPPLRERQGDILYLANYFARRMAVELGRKEAPALSPQAQKSLEECLWPGNIRELKNVIERAVYRSDHLTIEEIEFNPFKSPYAPKPQNEVPAPETHPDPARETALDNLTHLPLKKAVADLEAAMLQKALQQAQFNQKKAAELLGLTYDQLRGLKRKYGSEFN